MSTPELKPLLNCPFCGKQPEVNGTLARCKAHTTWVFFSTWNTRHNPAESALNAAREAIENAPHEPTCNHDTTAEFAKRHGLKTVCDCWKAEALAQIDPQQSKTT